jgi:hypothetical protein
MKLPPCCAALRCAVLQGFLSFLRGVTTREGLGGGEEKRGDGGAGEEEKGAEGQGEEAEAAAEQRRLALERAVLAQWQRLRSLRVA